MGDVLYLVIAECDVL